MRGRLLSLYKIFEPPSHLYFDARLAGSFAAEHLETFEGLSLKNGSNQGQNLAVTALFVPSLLGSGLAFFSALQKKIQNMNLDEAFTQIERGDYPRNTNQRSLVSSQRSKRNVPLGPLGFDFAQHRQTLRPTVDAASL